MENHFHSLNTENNRLEAPAGNSFFHTSVFSFLYYRMFFFFTDSVRKPKALRPNHFFAVRISDSEVCMTPQSQNVYILSLFVSKNRYWKLSSRSKNISWRESQDSSLHSCLHQHSTLPWLLHTFHPGKIWRGGNSYKHVTSSTRSIPFINTKSQSGYGGIGQAVFIKPAPGDGPGGPFQQQSRLRPGDGRARLAGSPLEIFTPRVPGGRHPANRRRHIHSARDDLETLSRSSSLP